MAEIDRSNDRKLWGEAKSLVSKLNKTNAISLTGDDDAVYPNSVRVQKSTTGAYLVGTINRHGEEPKSKYMQKQFAITVVKMALEDGLKAKIVKS